jgi:hypothetical protein
MGNYINPSDIDNWPSGLTEEEQEAIVLKAEQLVEEALEDYFYEKPFDMELNGNDRGRLFIPSRSKILSVADVYVDGVRLTPSWYDFDENSVFIDLRAAMNELHDGGFEKWKSAALPTYWTVSTAGTSTVSRDGTNQRNGTYCLEFAVDALNSDVFAYQDFHMTPNKDYTLELFYFMSLAAKTARWMLRDIGSNVWLTSVGTWAAAATWNNLANALAYTQEEVEFIAYPTYSNYRLYLDRLAATSSSIFWDDVSVKHKEGGGVSDPELLYRMRRAPALFPHGFNNIRVIGTQGWATTPQAIKQACIIIGKWENDPSLYSTVKKSEKIGDYSYTNALGDGFEYLTGILQADLLLQNYINRRPTVMAP